MRSSWGDFLVVSLFQELWANSATSRSFAQLFCLCDVYGLRYCSIQVFILSVWPSVLGWKAVDRTPRLQHNACEKVDAKWGSRSDMILFGIPNQGTRCFRYLLATPGPSIVLWHGMNLAALEHPWSTMVRIESKPLDLGRSVMRSIDTYWKGPDVADTSNCWSGAFHLGRFVFNS